MLLAFGCMHGMSDGPAQGWRSGASIVSAR
jgi:hypothetical protein